MSNTWNKYPDNKPAESAKFSEFLVAYPNPRLYSGKYPELNRDIPKYIFDLDVWMGDRFAMRDEKVCLWTAFPRPEE